MSHLGVGECLEGEATLNEKPQSAELRRVNGEDAIVMCGGKELDAVAFLTVEDDQINAVHLVRNPEKLSSV